MTYQSFLAIQRLLICFIPLALIIGPFIADLFVVLSSLIFLFFSFSQKDFKYFKSVFFLVFVFLCFVLLIRSIFSNNYLLSLESSLFYFRFGLFSLAVWYVLEKDKSFIRTFYIFIIFTFIILFIDSFYQFFTGFNLLGYKYNGIRLSSFFGQEMVLGNYIARLMPLLIGIILYYHNSSKKALFIGFLFLILSDILVYISGERSAFFFLILTTIILVAASNKWKLLRLVSFIVSIVIIILLSVFNPSVKERMIDSTINQTNITGDEIYFFSYEHTSLYKTALNIFYDNPIFGVGTKMFRLICNDENYRLVDKINEIEYIRSCSTHPHNVFLQLLAETGLVGFLPVFVLFIFIIFQFCRQIVATWFKKTAFLSDFQICLYISIMLSIWPLVPSLNIFNNWISIIFYLPVGFLLFTYEKQNNKSKKIK